MKKLSLLPLTIILMFVLSGCSSGVSQEEYDSLLAENATLKAEVDTLKSDNQSLSDSNKELLDEKSAQVLDKLDDSYGWAWAQTSFGDGTICLQNDEKTYFQCHASNTYEISDEGIALLFSDLIQSVKTLGAISENISYTSISIKFYDSSGTYIMDVILKMTGNSCEIDTISCNYLHTQEILSALSKALNQ